MPEPLPISITVSLTTECNLHCTHCAVAEGPECPPAHWDIGMVDRLFSEIGERTPILDLTGGEPLLAWDVVRAIGMRAAERGMLWGVTTNGLLLNAERVKTLEDLLVYAVKVSLEGTPRHHEAVRGRGTFAAVLRAITRLRNSGIPVGVQMAVSTENHEDLPRLIPFLDEIGVSSLILFPLMPLGRQAERRQQVLQPGQLRQLVDDVRQLTTGRMALHFELPQCAAYRQAGSPTLISRCPAGFMIHLTSRGDAWPCPVFPFRLGSLMETTLDDLVNAPVMQQLRSRTGLRGACAHCPCVDACGGGCRAIAYTETGSLSASDPFCWLPEVTNHEPKCDQSRA